MRKAVAGFAVVALLLAVAGCPGGPKVKDLEAQVGDLQQKITELEGQVVVLTAERDSLQGELDKLTGDNGGKKPQPPTKKGGTGGSSSPGRKPLPPTKKGSKGK